MRSSFLSNHLVALLALSSAACGGAVTAQPSGATCPVGDVCTPIDSGTGGSTAPSDTGVARGEEAGLASDPDAGAASDAGIGPIWGNPADSATADTSAAIEVGSGPVWTDPADAAPVEASPVDAALPEGGTTTPAASTFSLLPHRVVDAKWSAPLGGIVMVSDTPTNALYFYDVATQKEQTLALPATPAAVAVDPTGLFAAIAYDAHVSWVNLQTGSITRTCDVSSDSADVALTTEGVAYILPATSQTSGIHAIDMTNCLETLDGSYVINPGGHLALHPSGKALFAADVGLSPSRIDRCDLTASPVTCTDSEGQNDWGTYEFCGNLWISGDGQRIYGACGSTLRVPSDPNASLCSYGGSLAGITSIETLFEATAAQEVAVIPTVSPSYMAGSPGYDANADTAISILETNFLGFRTKIDLPPFPLTGSSTAVGHGRFVFTTPSLDALYVIVQADPTSGALNDYGVVTLTP